MASITGSGAAALSPAAEGTGAVDPYDSGAATIVITAAGAGTVKPGISGSIIIPVSLSAVMTQTLPSTMALPALQLSAQAQTGIIATANVALPALTLEATGPNAATLTIPALELSASATSSNLLSAAVTLPLLQATGTTSDDRALSASLTLPKIAVSAVMQPGVTADTSMQLPRLRSAGVMVAGALATADVQIAILTADGVLLSENILTASVAIPAVQLSAYAKAVVTYTFTGWAVNTENTRTSEYDSYEFLAVGEVNGRYVGVSADGIYELIGGTDNTAEIAADVMFGFDSFRTEDLKRIKSVHIGYRADNAGDLVVQVGVDGEASVREYPVAHVSSDSGIKRGRAAVAKGLKSRYWQYGVKNVEGADFLIDDMNIFVQQHNRKVQ